MKQYNENWIYTKEATGKTYGGKAHYQRVYVHKDGFKLKKSGYNWHFLNGIHKGKMLPANSSLQTAMWFCERYGLTGQVMDREAIYQEINNLPAEIANTVKTFVIIDGVEVKEAIQMGKALFNY